MRQRYWYRNGDVRDADGLPMLSHNELAHDESQVCAPMVMRDIPEYQSPIDDRWITSRSWRREDLRRNDCVEVDPPRRKRGVTNEAFAAKRRLKVCEATVEAVKYRRQRISAQRKAKAEAMTQPHSRWHHEMRETFKAAQPNKRRKR